MQTTQTTILLSDHTTKVHLGVVKNVYIFVGPYMLPVDFVAIVMPDDLFCPIIFVNME
jgi:hypothetical protein